MTTLLDPLEVLGAWSLPHLWLPTLAWTLVAAPAYGLLQKWRAAHPLVQQWARQALLAALPLGLAAAALTDVSFAFFGAEAGRALSGGTVFLLPPVPAAVGDAPAPAYAFGVYHALGLLTLGACAAAAWRMGRLAASARALARFRRGLPARFDEELQRAVRKEAERFGLRCRVRAVFLDQPVVPMTFGLRRPIVVLPEALRDQPGALQMALAHELVHVRRRDALAQGLEQLTAALFAVHPLVGQLRRSIAACREEATDAAVLSDGSIRPHRYAALLRDVALSENVRRLPALAIAEDPRHLKTRIEAMKHAADTNRRFPHPARTGTLVAALLLSLSIGLAACSDAVTPDDPDAAEPPFGAPPQLQMGADADGVYGVAEKPPELIGGLESLTGKIAYPEFARKAGIDGRVFVQFVIDEEGNVTDPTVLRSPHKLLSEEALRVVQQAEFEPGRQDGQPVKVKMALPITFALDGASDSAAEAPGSKLHRDDIQQAIRTLAQKGYTEQQAQSYLASRRFERSALAAVQDAPAPPPHRIEGDQVRIEGVALSDVIKSIAVDTRDGARSIHIKVKPGTPEATKEELRMQVERTFDGEVVVE